jgi:RNase P/RNase MRP subunit POP5
MSSLKKQELQHFFLKVGIHYEVESLTAPSIKAMIVQAMKELYGQVGSSITIDVLRVESGESSDYTVLLRVPYSEVSRVWSALTVAGSYNGRTLLIHVIKISASLVGLAANSREFHF